MKYYIWQLKKLFSSVEFIFCFLTVFGCYVYVGESVVSYSRVFLSDFLMTMSENIMALIFPMIVSLPVAMNYVAESKSGNQNILFSKLSVRRYILCKLMNAILLGGVINSLPAVLYLLRIILAKGIAGGDALESAWQISLYPALYENQPSAYAMISIAALFICGAVFSTIGLGVAAICDKIYLAVLVPEIYYIGSALAFWGKLKPLDATTLYVLNNNPDPNLMISAVYAAALFCIGLLLFIVGVCKNVE